MSRVLTFVPVDQVDVPLVAGQPPTAAEADVLAAWRAGDRGRCLTELMRLYGPRLFRFCRLMLSDHSLAQDVHQSVFASAYQALPRFEARSSFRSWLFGIARHECLDALKARRRWRWRFLPQASERQSASPDATPESALAGQQAAEALKRCLQRLRAELRMLVVLRLQEDMSYEELGRLSSVRPGTLHARVVRTLPTLQRCLERSGVT